MNEDFTPGFPGVFLGLVINCEAVRGSKFYNQNNVCTVNFIA